MKQCQFPGCDNESRHAYCDGCTQHMKRRYDPGPVDRFIIGGSNAMAYTLVVTAYVASRPFVKLYDLLCGED